MNKKEIWKYLVESYKEAEQFLEADFGYRMWNRLHEGDGVLEELVEFKNLMIRLNILIRGIAYYIEIGGKRDVSSIISKTNNLIVISQKLHEAHFNYILEKTEK